MVSSTQKFKHDYRTTPDINWLVKLKTQVLSINVPTNTQIFRFRQRNKIPSKKKSTHFTFE